MPEAKLGRTRRTYPSVRTSILVAAIAVVTLVTWMVTVDRMQGMDAGPGTGPGGLGWFVGVWATMMAAMMLPSLLPTVLVFAGVSAEHRPTGRSVASTGVFIGGYLSAWTAFGLFAYGVWRFIHSAHLPALSWHAEGPLLAGGAIVAAGLYQLSPLKRRCLRHCRLPTSMVLGGRRQQWWGAARMGLEHGAVCIACCWGLMLILFALGVMSIVWMLVVAGLVFVEKVLPSGARVSPALAVAFVLVGIWVATAPASVPGLTLPGGSGAMRAMPAMGGHGGRGDASRPRTAGMGVPKSSGL